MRSSQGDSRHRLTNMGRKLRMRGTFGRFEEIPIDKMSAAQKEAYNCLVNGPRGRLPGPYKVWVHNPKLVHAADPLGRHFTPGAYSLTERELEIAVRVINTKSRSDYPTPPRSPRGKPLR